jgi:hypothetical protein
MSEKEVNNLFYVSSLIEHVGRKTKNRRGDWSPRWTTHGSNRTRQEGC